MRLNIGFDVFWRHQTNVKSGTVKHTPQMMGTTARFHCNQASVEVQHKRNQTGAPQTLSHDNLTGCV